jgi:hypothetical protein
VLTAVLEGPAGVEVADEPGTYSVLVTVMYVVLTDVLVGHAPAGVDVVLTGGGVVVVEPTVTVCIVVGITVDDDGAPVPQLCSALTMAP